MKRFILTLCVLFSVSTFSFARMMIQLEGDTVGFIYDVQHSCFDTIDPYFGDIELTPLSGFGVNAMWEFNSEDLKPLHFYVGGELGVKYVGLEASVLGGFAYKIADLGKARVEMNTTLGAGVEEVLFGGTVPYTFLATDFVFMPANRRWFYGGLGLIWYNSYWAEIYKEFGVYYQIVGDISIRLVAGIRL